MKLMSIVLFVTLFLTSRAVGGEVFGTIIDGGKPVAAGLKVEVSASNKRYEGKTDKFGSYRIFVKEKGKCLLKLYIKDQTPSVELFSYDKSTRYDWILDTKEGKISLRRK